MKSVCKLVLAIFLFTSVAFAEEGELPNGNRNCPNGQTTCFAGSEPTQTGTISSDAEDSEDSLLTLIQNYLDSIFDYFEVRE